MLCRYCNKECSSNGALAIHESCCKSNSHRSVYFCSFCNRELTNVGANVKIHEETCYANPNRIDFSRAGFYVEPKPGGWKCDSCDLVFRTRRELHSHYKEYNDHRIRKKCVAVKSVMRCCYCGKEWLTTNSGHTAHENYCFSNPNRVIHKSHPQIAESIAKISSTAKANKLSGGYRKGSGRGNKGIYKGYYCDSSWELAFVIYNIDHNIEFERNLKRFQYSFNGEVHEYIPDWIIDDYYVEIKGYWTEQWQAKLDQFPKNEKLRVIDKNGILPYIEYVEYVYGKDFTRLYE